MGIILIYAAFVIGIETTIVTTNDLPYPVTTEFVDEGTPVVNIAVTDSEVEGL